MLFVGEVKEPFACLICFKASQSNRSLDQRRPEYLRSGGAGRGITVVAHDAHLKGRRSVFFGDRARGRQSPLAIDFWRLRGACEAERVGEARRRRCASNGGHQYPDNQSSLHGLRRLQHFGGFQSMGVPSDSAIPVEAVLKLIIDRAGSSAVEDALKKQETSFGKVEDTVGRIGTHMEGITRSIAGLAGVAGVGALVDKFVKIETSASNVALAMGRVTGG